MSKSFMGSRPQLIKVILNDGRVSYALPCIGMYLTSQTGIIYYIFIIGESSGWTNIASGPKSRFSHDSELSCECDRIEDYISESTTDEHLAVVNF